MMTGSSSWIGPLAGKLAHCNSAAGERFVRVESILGQIVLLLVDVAFTACIILIGIYAYAWLFMSGELPSPVEIIALFSIFSIFFYSTFLTSVWAWVYCLSAWFVRLFTRLGLRRVLDVQDNPVNQLALAGAETQVGDRLQFGYDPVAEYLAARWLKINKELEPLRQHLLASENAVAAAYHEIPGEATIAAAASSRAQGKRVQKS